MNKDQSKVNITYCDAETIAVSLGAVEKGDYSPQDEYDYFLKKIAPFIFSTHFFNKDGNEVGHYLHVLKSFSDTRTWNKEKNMNGRIYAPYLKDRLINKKTF